MLWWVLLSCWIKSLIQAELGRYILVSGDTYVRAMNRLPGKIPLGRGLISFPVLIALIAIIPGIMGLAASSAAPARPSRCSTRAFTRLGPPA